MYSVWWFTVWIERLQWCHPERPWIHQDYRHQWYMYQGDPLSFIAHCDGCEIEKTLELYCISRFFANIATKAWHSQAPLWHILCRVHFSKETPQQCWRSVSYFPGLRVRATGRNCRQMRRKNIFGTKKNSFGENKWRKKILLPKNGHLNITDLGYFMPLNRQLTSWITCLKSVADQLIHYDNTFR